MTKIAFFITLFVAGLVCGLPAAPAQAQAARTFLSAAGSDSNNCLNVLTPCRHLAAAYAATAANGEIYVLDPANYGSVTIAGPVSIEGHGWASIAPVAGQAAITINAPGATDKINIIGVVLDGTNIANTTGIQFNSGGTLIVRDSVIRNFTNDGIKFAPNITHQTQLFVSNTLVSDNGGNGIEFSPVVLGGGGNVVVNRVEMENNGDGLAVNTNSGSVFVAVSDSVMSQSSTTGLAANSDGSTLNVYVRNCTIASNSIGLAATGNNAVISVTRSTIVNNVTGWFAGTSGVVKSYADNNIDGNQGGSTEPPGPLTYK